MKLRQTGRMSSRKMIRMRSSKNAVVPNDKWATLSNIMERGQPQTGETDLTLQVLGIYSLPETWLKLQASGSVDQWSYNVKLSDGVLSGGQMNQRELTEEEKKELETKKKPPPKINKKDLEAVRAEEERIAKEAAEKAEKEKAFQEMLDKMEPQEQFYYLKEMPTREAWVSFKEKNVVSMNKQGEKLIELENDVNVEKGFLMQVYFVPGPDENEKKRPKPKGISPDEVKPFYCVTWVDLTDVHNTPGLTDKTIRCPLQLLSSYQKRIDDLEAKTGVKVLNPTDPQILEMVHANDEENLDYVEKAQTYIYFRLYFSTPVNPILPDLPIPEPIDLIKKEEKPKKVYSVEEIEKDLLRQFKIAIAAIAKTYDEAMGDSAKGILIRREKGNVLSNAKREERENNINKFLEKFNNSGRANLLKEKLKKFIVKIVREKYNKKNTSVKGVFKDKRDQFYSELYAYLTDYVKKATNEFVRLKKDELHEYVLVSFSQSKKEIMNYAERQNHEPEDKKLLRLSKENELLNDYGKALKYYRARLALEESKVAWISYANLAKKLDDILEVENAITKAIMIDQEVDDLNLKIIYAGLLFLKGETQNAINFMTVLLIKREMHNTTSIFNAFLAFLYKESTPQSPSPNQTPQNQNELLFKKYFEAAKDFKLKSLPPEEIHLKEPEVPEEPVDPKEKKKEEKKVEPTPEEIAAKEAELKKGNPKLHPEYRPPELTIPQIDSIWFDTINLFNEYNLYEISEKILSYVHEETTKDVNFKLSKAKIALFRKEYDKVIEECEVIISQSPTSDTAYLLKGNAYYYLKKYDESEECYIKAIRFKPQEVQFDIDMLTKLGLSYIGKQSWYDAKVVFKQILRDSVEHSFAWRYLGLTLTKLGEYEDAEKALIQANLLDVENPIIWAYFTIFCLSTGRKSQAIECLNELNKVNFRDIDILNEIAEMFYNLEEYLVAANIYIRMTSIEPSEPANYLKIAEIYYEHIEEKSKEAIKLLEDAKEKLNEEGQKMLEQRIEEYQEREDFKITGVVKSERHIDINIDELNLTESAIKGNGEIDSFNDDHEHENNSGFKEEEFKEEVKEEEEAKEKEGKEEVKEKEEKKE